LLRIGKTLAARLLLFFSFSSSGHRDAHGAGEWQVCLPLFPFLAFFSTGN
jgi:hypothetical protein